MNKFQIVKGLALLILLTLVAGCGKEPSLTVTNVIQNADRLDGTIIRVRGQAYLWADPSQAEMWMSGGCIPKTDPSYRQGVVTGWLTLYDSIAEDEWAEDGTPRGKTGIKISEENFHCGGDTCRLECSPFEAVSLRMYEFVGRLRVSSGSEFILEDIDLSQSSQFVGGTWTSIPAGKTVIAFP